MALTIVRKIRKLAGELGGPTPIFPGIYLRRVAGRAWEQPCFLANLCAGARIVGSRFYRNPR